MRGSGVEGGACHRTLAVTALRSTVSVVAWGCIMAGETTRQRYLDAVVEHMMAQGRVDVPLVELADAAGTSDRMLVYYFKTREALLTEAVAAIRRRRQTSLASALAKVPRSTDPVAALTAVLHGMVDVADATGTRLVAASAGRAFQAEAPFDAFCQGSMRDAVDEAALTARRMGADEGRAADFGTLFAAIASALALDLLTTGDTERVEAAIGAGASALVTTLDLPGP